LQLSVKLAILQNNYKNKPINMTKYLSSILLIHCLLINFISCKSQYTRWEYDKSISQIEFEKIRYKLAKHDTLLIIGLLKKETKINGFSCAADWVNFTKDFKLQFFKLSNSYMIEKTVLNKDTWVSLKINGRFICVLPKDSIIQGHQCMGGGGQEGLTVNFDLNGNLRSFYSPTDIKIDKIFCSGGKSNEIGLLKNGALEYCTFSIDQNINDVKYRQGSIVSFDYNGNVSNVKEK
jgi:hypothetical protein